MAMFGGPASGVASAAAIRDMARLGTVLGPAVRPVVVLLFLAVVPTAAIAGLLRTLDGFARLVIACVANITILALIAMIMLAEGVWSPRNGLLAVAAIAAMCLVAQMPPVRRGATALVTSGQGAAARRAARRSAVIADEDLAQTDAAGPVTGPTSRADNGQTSRADNGQTSGADGADTGEILVFAASDAEAMTAEIPVIRIGEPGDPDERMASEG